MDTLLNVEMSKARSDEMERVARRRNGHEWPDDGLPPRTESHEENHGSLHPAAVLARVFSWR